MLDGNVRPDMAALTMTRWYCYDGIQHNTKTAMLSCMEGVEKGS